LEGISDAVYATDLTDAEGQLLAPLIPAAKPGGRPRTQDIPVLKPNRIGDDLRRKPMTL